jgi:hypothetical protein
MIEYIWPLIKTQRQTHNTTSKIINDDRKSLVHKDKHIMLQVKQFLLFKKVNNNPVESFFN